MELDVLRKRAEKVSGGSASSDRLNNELRLIPDWSFTCSGTITGFLLGVDIRTLTSASANPNRDEFPDIQLWRKLNNNSGVFTKMNSTKIILQPGEFAPDGVIRYQLPTEWQYQRGDILGVYHPTHAHCTVRIFYEDNQNNAPNSYRLNNNPSTASTVDLDYTKSLTTVRKEMILVTPVTAGK